MSRTPGVIIPSFYSSQEELEDDLRRRDEEAGHTPFGDKVKEFIEHYGTKGMKWGIRNKRKQVKVSSDYKKTAPLRKRKTSELTNKQLQNVNARIKLEEAYVRGNPSHFTQGQKAVAQIIALAGTAATVYGLRNNPALKVLVEAGKNRLALLSKKEIMELPYEQLKLFK